MQIFIFYFALYDMETMILKQLGNIHVYSKEHIVKVWLGFGSSNPNRY